VSRSAGRSVVAAAAYRLGERLQDERYQTVHDYTRRRGVECAFTVAPVDAPSWAHQPEALWNAAEQAEKRVNSTLAREVELALPSLLSPAVRRAIGEAYAAELVDRYNVAVSVAIHEPGKGDERNYHAHILFTTREMTPEGLGKKTRILDDRKTGPQEVTKLRELAADLINEQLKAAHSDLRVDHRSFEARGIEKEPKTHLGPAASEMERRGEQTERGGINRDVENVNAMLQERAALEAEIETARREEQERLAQPPTTREDERARIRAASGMEMATAEEPEPAANPPATVEEERERIRAGAKPFTDAIRTYGELPERDGMNWWQRAALQISTKARSFFQAIASKAKGLWQDRVSRDDRDDRKDREEREKDDDRGQDR
jgi:hypothetical protein